MFRQRNPGLLFPVHRQVPKAFSPGGYSQKSWVGVCAPLPKTLILYMTKIAKISENRYPIYDQNG